MENSGDFVFDNQLIAQAVMFGFRIGEISCQPNIFLKPHPSVSAAAFVTAWV